MLLHERRDLVAAPPRHADVRKNDVGSVGGETRDRLLAVTDRHNVDVFARERQLDTSLDRDAVVGQQKLGIHWFAPAPSVSPTRGRACRAMKSTICCIGVPGRKIPVMPLS